jgi:hypothetical protein
MITVKELRALIEELPDETRMGIDDDHESLVFRHPDSRGMESLLEIGRLDAFGEVDGESIKSFDE